MGVRIRFTIMGHSRVWVGSGSRVRVLFIIVLGVGESTADLAVGDGTTRRSRVRGLSRSAWVRVAWARVLRPELGDHESAGLMKQNTLNVAKKRL